MTLITWRDTSERERGDDASGPSSEAPAPTGHGSEVSDVAIPALRAKPDRRWLASRPETDMRRRHGAVKT
jgi:hypothetical protein